jgi:hypothetical protein
MAELGNGLARFISDDDSIARELEDLFSTLEAPVMSGLRISFLDRNGGLVPAEILPKDFNSLFAGHPIQVLYRIAGGEAPAFVQIEAEDEGVPKHFKVPMANRASRGTGVQKRFGQLAYESLQSRRRCAKTTEENSEIGKQMLELALQYQLVTELTSRVAVEQRISRAPNAPLVNAAVPQYGAHDQSTAGDDGEFVVLSPFEVSADNSGGYSASQTIGGCRLRTDLKDIAASVMVVTRDLLIDLAAKKPEELPACAGLQNLGSDDILFRGKTVVIDNLPIATLIDPATIERIGAPVTALDPVVIFRCRSTGTYGNVARTCMGDEGYFDEMLSSTFPLARDRKTSGIAILSAVQQQEKQWGGLLGSRHSFDDGAVEGSYQWRNIERYGGMQLAAAECSVSLDENLWTSLSLAHHVLDRDDPHQFALGSPTRTIDGLGSFNLDLLTAQVHQLSDWTAQAILGGKLTSPGTEQQWRFGSFWHQQAMDWVSNDNACSVARERSDIGLEVSHSVRALSPHIEVKSEVRFDDIRLKHETEAARSSHCLAETLSFEVARDVHISVAGKSELLLPAAPTGRYVASAGDATMATAPTERSDSVRTGVTWSLFDGKFAGEVAVFRERVKGLSYRDWAWERLHAGQGAIALPNGLIQDPINQASWGACEKDGVLGVIHFDPTRNITGIVSFYEAWGDHGPVRGGNRRVALAIRYLFEQGMLKNLSCGTSVAGRDTIVFDDGYRIEGATRLDLFLKYRIHLLKTHWTELQFNVANLNNATWQATRFSRDRGRQFLFSVTQEF